MEMDQKIAYEAPEVVKHGSFEEITEGSSRGRRTDKLFPANTDFEDLTFS